MDQNMENEMQTGEIQGFKELKISYYTGETPLFAIYTHYGNLNRGLRLGAAGKELKLPE